MGVKDQFSIKNNKVYIGRTLGWIDGSSAGLFTLKTRVCVPCNETKSQGGLILICIPMLISAEHNKKRFLEGEPGLKPPIDGRRAQRLLFFPPGIKMWIHHHSC